MKKEAIKTVTEMTVKLTADDKKQLEQDALEFVGEEQEPEHPVVLDLESIRMLKPGKFEIDLIDLFKGKPLVYKLAEGKYVIDLASTFKGVLDEDEKATDTTLDDADDEEENVLDADDSSDKKK